MTGKLRTMGTINEVAVWSNNPCCEIGLAIAKSCIIFLSSTMFASVPVYEPANSFSAYQNIQVRSYDQFFL